MSSDIAAIQVTDASGVRRIPFHDNASVGRDPVCTVILSDVKCSRRHCVIDLPATIGVLAVRVKLHCATITIGGDVAGAKALTPHDDVFF